MKFKLLLLSMLTVFSLSVSAQSFFKPLPKLAKTDRFALGVSADSTMNAIRPLVGVTAIVSDGTQLAGGIGVGLQHLKYDDASQTWVMQYSVSALGFLGSNGTNATFTGGIAIGFLNLFQIGGGYDFTNKRAVLITGVGIQFN